MLEMLEKILAFLGIPPKKASKIQYIIKPRLVSAGVAQMDFYSLKNPKVLEQVEMAESILPSKSKKSSTSK